MRSKENPTHWGAGPSFGRKRDSGPPPHCRDRRAGPCPSPAFNMQAPGHQTRNHPPLKSAIAYVVRGLSRFQKEILEALTGGPTPAEASVEDNMRNDRRVPKEKAPAVGRSAEAIQNMPRGNGITIQHMTRPDVPVRRLTSLFELPGQKTSHDAKADSGDEGKCCKGTDRQHHDLVFGRLIHIELQFVWSITPGHPIGCAGTL
jgi:hypothetical protein